MPPFDTSKFPSKVYLSGSDCFHLVLDKHSQKNKAGGNVMHKVFYFESALPIESITQTLQNSALVYWLCNIRIVMGSLWRIPYWKFTDEGRRTEIQTFTHAIEEEIPAVILEREIPLDADRFIVFSYIQYPSGRSALVMSWNHIVMDGKGTSLLIQHLDDLTNGLPNQFDKFFPVKEQRPNVIGYIQNMYKVKHFIQNSSKPPIASVARTASQNIPGFLYRRIEFTAEQTKEIEALAFQKGARFGSNLYYLSCCIHTVHSLLKHKKRDGVMWIPIPYDGRLRGATGPVISNCVSYLFYRLTPTDLTTLEQTVRSLNLQMTEQIKVKMPQRYNKLLNMMRHIPLWLYYFLISRTGDGAFSSFLYSSTGNNFNELDTLFGERVTSLTVYPCPTYPPGLTFIFLRHNNALDINFTYSPADINEEEVNSFEQQLKQLLLYGG